MPGWMDKLQLYFLFTVFWSYQDNKRYIMKGFVQCNPVYGWTVCELDLEFGIASSDGKRLIYWAIGLRNSMKTLKTGIVACFILTDRWGIVQRHFK